MAQQRRTVASLAGEQIVAFGIRQAHVHVHAGARQVVEWLGHKAGGHSVFVGHALDQTLVAHRFVHRLQGVGAVLQGDFYLAWGVFRDRDARGNALQFEGAVEVSEEGFDLLQLAQALDLGRARATVAVGFLVQQVKLKLSGHDRVYSRRP